MEQHVLAPMSLTNSVWWSTHTSIRILL